MILKATFALGAVLAMQALPASAQDAASATTATSSLRVEFEQSGIPAPRLIAVVDDESGWHLVEIIL